MPAQNNPSNFNIDMILENNYHYCNDESKVAVERFQSKFLVHDIPSFTNIHSRLTGALMTSHLEAYHSFALFELFLRELAGVGCGQLSSDTWALIAVLKRHGADSVQGE